MTNQFEDFGYTLVYTSGAMGWRRDVDGAEAHVMVVPRKDGYCVTLHWGQGAVSGPVDCDDVIEAVEAGQKFHLAILFSTLLVEEYGSVDMVKVLVLNQGNFAEKGACATREIGDANRIMAEAWGKTFKSAMDPMMDCQRDMWSGAWELAKAAEFYIGVYLKQVIADDAYVQIRKGSAFEQIAASSLRDHWFTTVHWSTKKNAHITPFACQSIGLAASGLRAPAPRV